MRFASSRVRFYNDERQVEYYAALLQKCTEKRSLREGRKIHERVKQSGLEGHTYLGNLLVRMYGRCGSSPEAASTFASIHVQNTYSWTLVIASQVLNGCTNQAFGFFHNMQLHGFQPTKFTLTNILAACSGHDMLQRGIWLHGLIASLGYHLDTVIVTNLISMYTRCGNVDRAWYVFLNSPVKNVYSWTVMIGCLTQYGHCAHAIQLFEDMLRVEVPNQVTYLTILGTCCTGFLERGITIHERIVREGMDRDVKIGTAIVSMYGKYGCLDLARQAFERIEHRNLVSWNAMISAYAQNGHCTEALELYRLMETDGFQPDRITYLAVLEACASAGDLPEGRRIHFRLSAAAGDSKLQVGVGNTLVNMYGKCGSLIEARNAFDAIPRSSSTVVSWNAIISAYAQNGDTKEALLLVKAMDPEGFIPDSVTFINALFACSHAGMLDDARGYLVDMVESYGLKPRLTHYSALLDLMARLGILGAAEELACVMPFYPNDAVWLSLLKGYAIHDTLREFGLDIVEKVGELDPENSAPYVMLSNIYQSSKS